MQIYEDLERNFVRDGGQKLLNHILILAKYLRFFQRDCKRTPTYCEIKHKIGEDKLRTKKIGFNEEYSHYPFLSQYKNEQPETNHPPVEVGGKES